MIAGGTKGLSVIAPMSDGMSEGYRAELEATARAKRMAKFGQEMCFTCAKVLKGGERVHEEFDRDVFLQAELILEGGRAVPGPKKIMFCSELCKAKHTGAMHLVSRMVDLLAREPCSPAFRTNFRKHMLKVLKTTETPDV